MLKYLAVVAAGALALAPATALAAAAWEPWVSVPGVFDLGTRSDGSILVAGNAMLYLLTPGGNLTAFASGYHDDPGAEAYLAVSSGQDVSNAGCFFPISDAFILRLHAPTGVTRVSRNGDETVSFANVAIPGLNGIAFDTVGAFDHRLLVSGSAGGKSQVVAIDCAGKVQMITTSAPAFEGGLDVAPMTFGSFGGWLVAPDELSGVIWAIAPDGSVKKLVDSGLPKGGDIGVESLAFVPPGFTARGGYAYYSDRATPNNPHPGTDHVLRLSSNDLWVAGVQDGDLLGATEGGASMVDVRCEVTCTVFTVVPTPTTAHGEGHLVFTLNQLPSPSPKPSAAPASKPASSTRTGPSPATVLVAGIIAAVLVAVVVASRRRR